jgi:transposase
MWGTRDLHYYQLDQIKRVRIVRRADGYYIQVCLDVERVEAHEFQNTMVGIDVGLNHFYTDSDGNQIENPRFLRKSEKALKRLNRRLHRQKKASKNRAKERKAEKTLSTRTHNATDAVCSRPGLERCTKHTQACIKYRGAHGNFNACG